MEKTNDREIRMVKTFAAPINIMWEAWTNPDHITNWWGPDGFTSTIHKMNIQEGGEWIMTLHSPDGTNFPNKSIFKEIIPFKKILFEHFYPHFMTTVLFTSKGEETQVDWTLLFNTAEMRETIVIAHKADEGQKQNMEKLEKYLSTLPVNKK